LGGCFDGLSEEEEMTMEGSGACGRCLCASALFQWTQTSMRTLTYVVVWSHTLVGPPSKTVKHTKRTFAREAKEYTTGVQLSAHSSGTPILDDRATLGENERELCPVLASEHSRSPKIVRPPSKFSPKNVRDINFRVVSAIKDLFLVDIRLRERTGFNKNASAATFLHMSYRVGLLGLHHFVNPISIPFDTE
jgi:hypothetical protein